MLHPAMRWALRNKGDVILDIGYGARGSSILNLLEGVNDEKNFRVILVVNALRPMTDTVEKIVEYHNESGPAHGLIANTHMGDDTELPQIIKGYEIVKEVSQILQIPIDALAVDQLLFQGFSRWDLGSRSCASAGTLFAQRFLVITERREKYGHQTD